MAVVAAKATAAVLVVLAVVLAVVLVMALVCPMSLRRDYWVASEMRLRRTVVWNKQE